MWPHGKDPEQPLGTEGHPDRQPARERGVSCTTTGNKRGLPEGAWKRILPNPNRNTAPADTWRTLSRRVLGCRTPETGRGLTRPALSHYMRSNLAQSKTQPAQHPQAFPPPLLPVRQPSMLIRKILRLNERAWGMSWEGGTSKRGIRALHNDLGRAVLSSPLSQGRYSRSEPGKKPWDSQPASGMPAQGSEGRGV